MLAFYHEQRIFYAWILLYIAGANLLYQFRRSRRDPTYGRQFSDIEIPHIARF